jgi:hypothetical protein
MPGTTDQSVVQPLRDTLTQLEERIVLLVVLAPQAAVGRALEAGLLWAGMAWSEAGKPTGPSTSVCVCVCRERQGHSWAVRARTQRFARTCLTR